jgi:hypothetical protein
MTLLDRFRSQARDKHPDVAVRLGYVDELPLDDRQAIAVMAREDGDPRVRRAAVAKLMDPAALGAVLRSDADESVRSRSLEMLRDIAVEAFEGTTEAESLAAVVALGEITGVAAPAGNVVTDAQRVLGQIAKTAARETVALQALSRLSDGRQFGTVARHGATEAARRAALDALQQRGDSAEIVAVALNGDYKDVAAAAVDFVTERAQLEQIVARGLNKSAVKRAKVTLREMDERAAREAAEYASAEMIRAAATVDSLQTDSPMSTETLLDPAPSPSPAETGQTATDPVQQDEADRLAAEREREEPAPAAEPASAAVAPAEDAESVAAAAAATALEVARRTARLSELADEAAAAASLDDLGAARKRVALARREWADLTAAGPADEMVAARFAEADARFAARDAEAQEADARSRREGLARMHNLLGRVEQLAARTDMSLKAADRALRDVRAALSAIPMLPTKADFEDVTARLKAVQVLLTPKVTELREADEWQKWANVTIQEQLCAKMEALGALEDAEVIAKEVRELQQQWRQAADVPRDKADGLWRRFKAAHDAVWARCESHFAAEAQARADNLAKKIALCEQAEALSDSTDWLHTAEAIKKLQSDWKEIGPVSRGREKAIWDRFRTACDRFFTRRHDDLAQRKTVWTDNLAKKDALCARAEALAESTDWDASALEIKRLQAEWKSIGPVKKSRSEAIWQRFRTACDRFFERYTQRHDIERADRVAAREAICAELEALAPPPPAEGETAAEESPADLVATVRTLRGRWQQEIAARGVDLDRARALDARFADAFARVVARWPAAFNGTDLDPDANRKRMEALVKKVEDLVASLTGPAAAPAAEASPASRLAAMLKEALAANTIGGRAGDDSRWRAAAEEVRQAQAAWSRLGPVPDATRRQLLERFQRASRRITERAEAAARPIPSVPNGPRTGRSSGPGGGGGRPGGEAGRSRDAAPRPQEHAGREK